MSAGQLDVAVITPKAEVARLYADALSAPTSEGEITVLPGHATMLSTLSMGRLSIRHASRTDVFFVTGGVLEVDRDRAMLLVQAAERPEDIDVTRAEQEATAAEARLRQLEGPQHPDYARQRQRLARAQARLEMVRPRLQA